MRRSGERDRVLATVLFTDIVGSTELATSLGDRRWEDLRRRHHAVIRAALKRFRGREMDTAGDGFFAVFDRPAQAIRCAVAIVEAVRSLGIELRAGLHAGEVEVGREKVGGIAVVTAARVLAAASPGQIVVTATVKDLVAGSEIEFVERGAVTLRGIPGEWRLYAVVVPAVGEVALPGVPATVGDASRTQDRRGRRAHTRAWALIGITAVVVLGAVAASAILIPSLLVAPVVPGADTVARIPAGGDRFDVAVNVGSRPTAVASGDGAIWVLNFRDQTVSRIDPSSGEVVSNSSVGGAPTGLAVGGGWVWVTTGFGGVSGETGAVIKLHPRLGPPEGTIPVGSGASAIAFGDGAVWVADRVGDRLLRIDPRTNEVDEVSVGRAPGAVAVAHGSVWVTTTLDDALWRVNPQTPFEVTARIQLSGSPSAVAASDDAVWVTSQAADSVTRIDPATNARVTTLNPGNGPTGVAAASGETWVALGLAGEVVKIDDSNAVVARFRVDGAPEGIAIDAVGATWVSVHGQ